MKVLSVQMENDDISVSLIQTDEESVIVSLKFIRIGLEDSKLIINNNKEVITEEIEVSDYNEVINILFDRFITLNIINNIEDIKGIGFKLISSFNKYNDNTVLTNKVMDDLLDKDSILYKYNKNIIELIKSFKDSYNNTFMTLIFDNSFHNTLDISNYLYPVPYKWYRDYGVRKYGYDGINHKYSLESISSVLNKKEFKMISCYGGDTVSICAIKDMESIDISSGFTPLSGVMMNTVCGDVDSSIIPYIMGIEGKNVGEVIDDLNTSSGLLGISQYSGDIGEILTRCEEMDENAILSKNMFIRRIVDYIAKYYVLLDGVDVLVFSGDIFNNYVSLRREICEKLSCLGIKIDLDINSEKKDILKISSDDSLFDVYVLVNNSDLMISREIVKLFNR